MKILISCLSESWGGMEMYTLTTIDQLIKNGLTPSLLCVKNSRIYNEAKHFNVKIFTVESVAYFQPAAIKKLMLIFKKNQFDIIHSHASKDLWLLSPALFLIRSTAKLFLTKHVGSFVVKKDLLHKLIYKRLTAAFAISNVIKQNLIDTCPLKSEKIKLLHDAIDTQKFNPSLFDKQLSRKEFNFSDSEISIGMMARFSPGKGHEEFLEAAHILCSKYSNLKFLIIGEPSKGESEYGKKIEKLSNKLNLSGKIIFTGYRTDIPFVLSALNIFAFPSHAEAFGLALVEAMSMELPVVCSNSDGVLDINIDNITGYFFEKGNATSLAEKLELLIESEQKRFKFGKAARNHVISNFDLSVATFKTINLYKEYLRK